MLSNTEVNCYIGTKSRREKFSFTDQTNSQVITQVFDLGSTCVSFGHPLVELKFARKSTQVFHRLATQRKSTQINRKSTVKFPTFCDPT